MANIGQEIRRIRERHNMGPIEFADTIGISRQTIRRLEQHGDLPTTRVLQKIANAFGLVVDIKFRKPRVK